MVNFQSRSPEVSLSKSCKGPCGSVFKFGTRAAGGFPFELPFKASRKGYPETTCLLFGVGFKGHQRTTTKILWMAKIHFAPPKKPYRPLACFGLFCIKKMALFSQKDTYGNHKPILSPAGLNQRSFLFSGPPPPRQSANASCSCFPFKAPHKKNKKHGARASRAHADRISREAEVPGLGRHGGAAQLRALGAGPGRGASGERSLRPLDGARGTAWALFWG